MTSEHTGCVLVVAWIFVGCAAPPPRQQNPQQQPEREVSINLCHETNSLPPPVGYWVVDARATAHAAAVRYGFRTNRRVEGTRTNYSYTYYGPARDIYARVLKRVSDPDMQHSLVFRADGTGESRLIASEGLAPPPASFGWCPLQKNILQLEFPLVTVEAAFKTNEIRYPTPDGVLIFTPGK